MSESCPMCAVGFSTKAKIAQNLVVLEPADLPHSRNRSARTAKKMRARLPMKHTLMLAHFYGEAWSKFGALSNKGKSELKILKDRPAPDISKSDLHFSSDFSSKEIRFL